jgi:type IV pilus assembly protein PilW
MTLVELLVAMAVGLFLLAGIIQLLITSRATYLAEEGFSRLQENGRYAVQAIAEDVRGTRNTGCRSAMLEAVTESINVASSKLPTGLVGPDSPVGFDATTGDDGAVKVGDWTALPSNVTAGWRRGDVLVLWGAGCPISYVSGEITDRTENPVVLAGERNPFQEGDIALVTDCEGTDIFTVSSVDGQNLGHGLTDSDDGAVNTSAELSRFYNRAGDLWTPGVVNRAMVMPFDFQIYFICSSNTAPPESTRSALCRWRPSDGVQELVPDVVDMRVTYHEDRDGDGKPDALFTANAVNDWANVYSAQVELLTASAEEVRSQTATVSDESWPGSGADRLGAGRPDDRRLYARFAFTVALRTRAPWYVAP